TTSTLRSKSAAPSLLSDDTDRSARPETWIF
ncbi:MAG: hypothetical protein ACI9MU_001924, partial [Alphaproteobacteria bacterium]